MAPMGKGIKTRAATEVKTLESVGEPGKRRKRAYIRAKQRKVGEASGPSPPPLGEERASNQAGAVHSEQPEYAPSAKGKTSKAPSPGERMKANFLQVKKAAVPEQPTQQAQPEDSSAQATEQVSEVGKRVGDFALHHVERTGRESLSQVNPRVEQVRESFRELKGTVENTWPESQRSPSKAPIPRKEGERVTSASSWQVRSQPHQGSFCRETFPIARNSEGRKIKTSAKGNVKTAAYSIKTAEWSSGAGIKTS